MKRLISLSFIIQFSLSPAGAQQWTARACMQYAVEHNKQVRQAALQLDNYEADRLGAVGRMLPAVDAAIGAQYNFGRAIDPETNGYTDVSTFYNGISVQASLPVFDGFSRLHALRAARASVLMGRSALRGQQDETALTTLQAWVNTVYYEGLVTMAEEKQREADLLARQTQVMVEVGRKSEADLAQMEAQRAEAAYELTRQQNLLASASLELKQAMAFPVNDELRVKNEEFATATAENEGTAAANSSLNPHHSSLQTVYHTMQSRLHEWRQTRAALFPTLSLSAGLSTTFYKQLHSQTAAPFSDQMKNNMGEYVAASLSIPLFNRMQTLTGIRRAKNNYRMAREAYEEKQQELEKLCREAWQDLGAYQKQTAQMERKVQADSLAYQLVRRQYEEGLSTAIDLHTTSATLLQSKATLLQCRLMAMLKQELVRYYNGEKIWTE